MALNIYIDSERSMINNKEFKTGFDSGDLSFLNSLSKKALAEDPEFNPLILNPYKGVLEKEEEIYTYSDLENKYKLDGTDKEMDISYMDLGNQKAKEFFEEPAEIEPQSIDIISDSSEVLLSDISTQPTKNLYSKTESINSFDDLLGDLLSENSEIEKPEEDNLLLNEDDFMMKEQQSTTEEITEIVNQPTTQQEQPIEEIKFESVDTQGLREIEFVSVVGLNFNVRLFTPQPEMLNVEVENTFNINESKNKKGNKNKSKKKETKVFTEKISTDVWGETKRTRTKNDFLKNLINFKQDDSKYLMNVVLPAMYPTDDNGVVAYVEHKKSLNVFKGTDSQILIKNLQQRGIPIKDQAYFDVLVYKSDDGLIKTFQFFNHQAVVKIKEINATKKHMVLNKIVSLEQVLMWSQPYSETNKIFIYETMYAFRILYLTGDKIIAVQDEPLTSSNWSSIRSKINDSTMNVFELNNFKNIKPVWFKPEDIMKAINYGISAGGGYGAIYTLTRQILV